MTPGVHVHHTHGPTMHLPLVDNDPMPALDALTASGAIAGASSIHVVGHTLDNHTLAHLISTRLTATTN